MTSDVRFDITTLILGMVVVLFWRRIGYSASWFQERLMRSFGLKADYTSGINLRNTQWVFLLVGIAMVASSMLSLAL